MLLLLLSGRAASVIYLCVGAYTTSITEEGIMRELRREWSRGEDEDQDDEDEEDD